MLHGSATVDEAISDIQSREEMASPFQPEVLFGVSLPGCARRTCTKTDNCRYFHVVAIGYFSLDDIRVPYIEQPGRLALPIGR